jgi:hypothetical protein
VKIGTACVSAAGPVFGTLQGSFVVKTIVIKIHYNEIGKNFLNFALI